MRFLHSIAIILVIENCFARKRSRKEKTPKTPKSDKLLAQDVKTVKSVKSSKGDKGTVCLEESILAAFGFVNITVLEAEGSEAASEEGGIEGWQNPPEDYRIGTQWTVNNPGSDTTANENLYGSGSDSVAFQFTDDYSSTGDAALCIENRCPDAAADCDGQKGYLQYYYPDVIENADQAIADCGDPCTDPTVVVSFTDYSVDGGVDVQPISVSDFSSFSYDFYPVECGAAADTGDNCGSAFYVNIRLVGDFLSDGGTCGFFDCSFDYQLPTDTGPEGSWTTFRIDGNTVPWRIRQGGTDCSCPLPGFTPGAGGQIAGISINDALENAAFASADMKLGTGYGEIAALNMGAQVGGPDYNLHGCFDNIIFSTTSSTDVFDFEQE